MKIEVYCKDCKRYLLTYFDKHWWKEKEVAHEYCERCESRKRIAYTFDSDIQYIVGVNK